MSQRYQKIREMRLLAMKIDEDIIAGRQRISNCAGTER